MSKDELIRRLQISCLGLDAVDPLRLLVDDVIEALAQTRRTWVGLTESERRLINFQWQDGNGTAPEIIDLVEAKLKEKNT